MGALKEYINQGGIFMYPILIGSLWALILFIERTIFFIQAGANMTRQVETFFKLIKSSNEKGAIDFIEN